MLKSPNTFGTTHIGAAIRTAVNTHCLNQRDLRRFTARGTVVSMVLNDSDVCDEGLAYVAALVKKAEKSFFASTYILDATSAAAEKLFKAVALKQEKNPNFSCYIAYNSLSSSSVAQIRNLLEKTGARINFAQYRNGFGRASLHSKLFIIDREIAVVGGDNIDNPKECDLLLGLKGPIVLKLLDQARSIWRNCHKYEFIDGRCCQSFIFDTEHLERHSGRVNNSSNFAPMMVLAKDGIRLVGDYYNNPANAGFFAAIENAKSEINLVSPNLNDAGLLERLQDAAIRGVQVNILIPKEYAPIASWIDRACNGVTLIYRHNMPEEFQKNINIRWFSDDGIRHSANHTKLYSIDNQVVLIGSMNGDNQSFSFSRELMLAIEGVSAVREIMSKAFDPFWELGLPAKERWWHQVLPIPEKEFGRRLSKALGIPLRLAQFLVNRVSQFVQGSIINSFYIEDEGNTL